MKSMVIKIGGVGFLSLALSSPLNAASPKHVHENGIGAMKKSSSSPSNGLSYSLGISALKTFASPDDPSSGDMGGMMGMNNMKGMHMDGDSKQAAVTPMFMAMLSYNLSRSFSIDLMLGAMAPDGVVDPMIGPSLSLGLDKHWTSYSSIYASAPLSKMSQDEFKTTTVTASTGLLRKSGKTTFFGGIEGSMSWYQKTMYDPNENGSESSSMHMLTLHGDEMSSMDHDMTDSEKTLMMMEMREFNHTAAIVGAHYDYSNKIRAHFDGKLTRTGYMKADPMWTTRVTVIDIGFAQNGFMNMGFSSMPMGMSVDGAFALVKADESISAPSVPQIIVGVAYGGM